MSVASSNSLPGLPTGRPGQMLAAALAFGVLVLLWLALAQPLLSWYGDRQGHLARRAALADRMAQLAQTLPALRREAAAKSAGPADGTTRSTVLSGDTDAIAGATLQQLVQDMAARSGASLPSVETLPVTPAGAYRRIGLRVTVDAPWPVLISLLQAVEQASPQMLVDDLHIHAVQGNGGASAGGDPGLTTGFTVVAFRAAAAPQ